MKHEKGDVVEASFTADVGHFNLRAPMSIRHEKAGVKKQDQKIRTIQFAFDCPHCKGKNLVEVPRKEITMLRKALRQTYVRGLAMIKDCKFKVYGLNVDKLKGMIADEVAGSDLTSEQIGKAVEAINTDPEEDKD